MIFNFISDLTPLAVRSDKNRVEIKVYRGANNEEEEYAPWGFVVRQPIKPTLKTNFNADPWILASDKSYSVTENSPDPR